VTQPVLDVADLWVAYGTAEIIRGIDLRLGAGEWLGLLGANGAGKSTFLKALTCQVRPRAGRVLVDGCDTQARPVQAKRCFGYAVPPELLPFDLSGVEYLQLVATARGMARVMWDDADLIGELGLGDWQGTPLGVCSLGTRAKFSICAAMLGAPRLIILDETLNALDPLSNWHVRTALDRRVSVGGCSVILATHALETVLATCSSALFLEGGRALFRWDRAALEAARGQGKAFEATIMRAIMEGRSQASA